MTRGPSDLLRLLANPTNRSILSILALEPQYPRRLAEIVGLTEDEASRRLRAFEKIGLAEAAWANVGKTVRLYRLTGTKFTVNVTQQGLIVSGLSQAGPIEVGAVSESGPVLARFVGRDEEQRSLAALLDQRRAVCVHGIGGAGKTALAAHFAQCARRPTVWHTLAPAESGVLLLARLASNLRALETGERAQRLLSLRGGEEPTLLAATIVESLNALGALAVLDRFEGAGEGAGDVVAEIARGLTHGRLLITSRTFAREFPRDAIASFRLAGLSRADAEALLDALGAKVVGDLAAEVYERTHGHPLSLVLIALVGEEDRQGSVERLMEEAGIRDFLMGDVLPQLPESEREVLFATSVLREPFTADLAEAVSASKHARDALLRLEARGLASRSAETYRIHDLVRAFASEAAPNRKAVHLRAAKALVESGEPVKILEAMGHFIDGGRPGLAAGVVLEEATRRAYRFADLGLRERYRPLLDALAGAREIDASERAAVALELGVLDTFGGEPAAARMHLERAARALASRKDALAVRLAIARARLLRLDGGAADASRAYQAAERMAEKLGDDALLLEALVDHAFCAEEFDDSLTLRLYERAMPLAKKTSDIRLMSLVYSGAARVSSRSGEERFLEWAEEALRLARLAGYLRGEASVYMTLTTYDVSTGKTHLGLEHAERYLDIARRLGDPWLRLCAEADMGQLLNSTGQHEAALAMGLASLDKARAIKSAFYELGSVVVIAHSLVRLGRAEEAIPYIEPLLAREYNAFPMLVARLWRVTAAIEHSRGDERAAHAAEARADAVLAALPPAAREAAGPIFTGNAKPSGAPSRRGPRKKRARKR